METAEAMTAFAALAQRTRLEVLRLLIKAGADGMASGEIGAALGVKPNTMSTNLSILHQARLVRNERQGRTIRYYADMDGVAGLLTYLLEDCCGGHAEECRPLLADIVTRC